MRRGTKALLKSKVNLSKTYSNQTTDNLETNNIALIKYWKNLIYSNLDKIGVYDDYNCIVNQRMLKDAYQGTF